MPSGVGGQVFDLSWFSFFSLRMELRFFDGDAFAVAKGASLLGAKRVVLTAGCLCLFFQTEYR
jgi:hypothetical protein